MCVCVVTKFNANIAPLHLLSNGRCCARAKETVKN